MENSPNSTIATTSLDLERPDPKNFLEMSDAQLQLLAKTPDTEPYINVAVDDTWNIGKDGTSHKLEQMYDSVKAHHIGEAQSGEGKAYLIGLKKLERMILARKVLADREEVKEVESQSEK